MRYGFSGAELGAGTGSCALVPTMKLLLRCCGHSVVSTAHAEHSQLFAPGLEQSLCVLGRGGVGLDLFRLGN